MLANLLMVSSSVMDISARGWGYKRPWWEGRTLKQPSPSNKPAAHAISSRLAIVFLSELLIVLPDSFELQPFAPKRYAYDLSKFERTQENPRRNKIVSHGYSYRLDR